VSIRLRLVLWQTLLLGLVLTGFAAVIFAAVSLQAKRIGPAARPVAHRLRPDA